MAPICTQYFELCTGPSSKPQQIPEGSVVHLGGFVCNLLTGRLHIMSHFVSFHARLLRFGFRRVQSYSTRGQNGSTRIFYSTHPNSFSSCADVIYQCPSFHPAPLSPSSSRHIQNPDIPMISEIPLEFAIRKFQKLHIPILTSLKGF